MGLRLVKLKAIIFDVDGTLALRGDRSPYSWEKVDLDSPNTVVIQMLLGYRNWGYRIIIVSGRDDVCLKETTEWLAKHGIVYDKIFMRPAGDQMKDDLLKQLIFRSNIEPHYDVRAVVDDRPRVCRMWRQMGLPVIQIGDPYKEF